MILIFDLMFNKYMQKSKKKCTCLKKQIKKKKNPHISSYNATVEGTQAFNIKT